MQRLEDICNEIASQCIASRIRFLSRVITAIYDEELRPFGLTLNQLNTLVLLVKAKGCNAKRVGELLQMDPSTVSRNLERMKQAGWIRFDVGKDARSFQLSVTKKGEKMLEKAAPAWRKAQKKASQVLKEGGATAVSRAALNLQTRI
jgi:DNA-binding MarR family transcriptional regulator